ncbi:MAG: serine hydrolase, partial [Pseudomonadota bacterium]
MFERIPRTALLALAIGACAIAHADNGRIGYAGAMAPITVDGQLSEWPAALQHHPIEVRYFGNEPENEQDLSASFRIGFNADRDEIYVAVEIVDDSHRTPPGERRWLDGDGVAIYIDATHSPRGSGPIGYAASGDLRELIGTQGAWDPLVAAASLDTAEIAIDRSGNRTIYEYRVAAARPVEAGMTIGFDVLVRDLDENDEGDPSSVYWGQFFGKSRLAGRAGDVLLRETGGELATLRGQTRWADDLEKMPADVPAARLTSVGNPSLWFQVAGDDDGRYEVDVPPGEYTIDYPYPIWGMLLGPHQVVDEATATARATVAAGSGGEAEPLVLRPRAQPDLYQDTGVLFDYAPAREQEIDEFVQAYMDYFSIPGVSLALVHDGEIVYRKTHGVRNAYTGDPVEPDTVFEAASITKIVFAFAVLRLAERGVIDLDQPLHELLPFEEIAHDERYEQITARHVLTHRTG